MSMQTQDQHALAESLIPLVHDVAGQVARRVPAHVMLDDLIGAGMLGLATALTRYEPARSDTFKGYAEFRIRGAIMDELRRRDIMSREARIESKKLQRTIQQLNSDLGRQADDDEIADYLDVSLETYRAMQLRFSAARMVSADALDLATEDASPLDSLDGSETRDRLADGLKQLPKRQALVLWLYYYEELPLREIADRLGVTPSRICQIRGDAVASLRRHMEDTQLAA